MILYNGATGGLGKHLPGALKRRGAQAHALSSRLEDREGLRRELAGLTPGDEVLLLQLAAMVSVPGCESNPDSAMKTNVEDTRETVAEFVRWAKASGARPRVLYVSSGHIYAAQPAGVRITESHPTAPRSVYARTKLLAENELAALAAKLDFKLSVARVFGLIAPQQPSHYVLPGLIKRVRENRLDGVPGLDYVRDYLDSRDVCDDLLALAAVDKRQSDTLGSVNICSGEAVTLRALLQQIVRTLRPGEEEALMSSARAAPGRPDDVPSILGDPSHFVRITGKQPRTISLGETVRDACAAD